MKKINEIPVDKLFIGMRIKNAAGVISKVEIVAKQYGNVGKDSIVILRYEDNSIESRWHSTMGNYTFAE